MINDRIFIGKQKKTKHVIWYTHTKKNNMDCPEYSDYQTRELLPLAHYSTTNIGS